MNYRIRKFPPLVDVPFLMGNGLKMVMAGKRKKYGMAMEIGREILGSVKMKKKAFKGYTPGKEDVFVCTYSKSGTYWMMQIVTQIANLGEGNFDHIHDWVPWPDLPMENVVYLSEPTWQHTPTQKRAIKTHLESEYVPYSEDATYIVVVRDPKDVIISSFYFSNSIVPGMTQIGLDAWTESFMKGETPYGSWPAQVASYWEMRDLPNVHIVRFEDMKRDLTGAIKNVAEWIDVDLSDEEFQKVVSKSEFKSMKAEEQKFLPPLPPGVDRSSLKLLREGNSGVAKKELTAGQMALVDQAMKAELKRLGSDFPYEEFYGKVVEKVH